MQRNTCSATNSLLTRSHLNLRDFYHLSYIVGMQAYFRSYRILVY